MNALGSVITNTTLILGVGALYGTIAVKKKSALNVWLILGSLTALFTTVLVKRTISGKADIPRFLGIIFLIAVPIYLYSYLKRSDEPTNLVAKDGDDGVRTPKKVVMVMIAGLLGSALLVAVSSAVLVATVQVAAKRLGMSEAVISATIVALGTSLPELSTVIVSVKKGYGGLAFGNLLGASLMNIFLVLGTTITFSKTAIQVPMSFLQVILPLAIGIVTYMIVAIYNTKKRELTRLEGSLFIVIYLIYLLFNLVSA
ncbi:sodium:calcium antiporter [Lactococcus insecticola]|uniref:Sodium:calcium antiporter n=1 Tax=Pseudolactococcus insecticola TaxID=2709158 RepID=A0A6A0B4Z8_9LACT|nr:sodium:calcium antiporter [Lactococcus insecticola]GFH40440.1 sodium:calcium antiporter [Lactococcus insecticola]